MSIFALLSTTKVTALMVASNAAEAQNFVEKSGTLLRFPFDEISIGFFGSRDFRARRLRHD